MTAALALTQVVVKFSNSPLFQAVDGRGPWCVLSRGVPAAVGLGVLTAVPRSSQRRTSDTFWWGAPHEPFDRERSERDVQAAYDEVSATYAFDVAQVLLGGFSQGAVLAVTGLWFTDDRFVPAALREKVERRT